MTHPDLPRLFADACAVCPELLTLLGFNSVAEWYMVYQWNPQTGSLTILGACVKVLAEKYMTMQGMPSLVINAPEDRGDIWRLYPSQQRANGQHPDPTCAACLAVVAVFKKETP